MVKRKIYRRRCARSVNAACLSVAASLFVSHAALALTDNWNGGSANSQNWDQLGNWSLNAAPGAGGTTTSTLTVGENNGSGVFSGKISNGPSGGVVALTKTGTGIQTLSAANTYTGATTINGGILRLIPALSAPVAGAALRLDATNNASLTVVGGKVTQWNDLSGNGRNAIVTSGSTGATLNASNANFSGKQTLTFAGGSTYDVDMSFLQNSAAYTIFAVEGVKAAGNQYFLGTNMANTNQGLHFGYRGTGDFTLAQYGNDLDATVPGYPGSQVGREFAGEFAPTAVTNGPAAGHYIFYNGGQVANSGSTAGFGSLTGITGIVGAGFAYNAKYNGDLAEVIIYNSALNSVDRAAVDAYLQAKYLGLGTATNVLPNNTAVTIAASSTLDINGTIQTIGSLTSASSTSSVTLGTGVLTIGNDGTGTGFAGSISGAGSVVKIGGGVLTLSGSNAYTGPTTISAGTLALSGSTNAISTTSSITVAAGATLDTSASTGGTVLLAQPLLITGTGTATVAGGVSAGANAINFQDAALTLSTLNITGAAGLALNGSPLRFDLGQTNNSNDKITVTSAATVAGSNVISIDALPGDTALGSTYTLLTAASGLGSGFTLAQNQITVNGTTYNLSLVNSSGSEILSVAAAPEPASIGLMALTATGLLARRRRQIT